MIARSGFGLGAVAMTRFSEAGYRFIRYADELAVVCQARQQANAALRLVESVLFRNKPFDLCRAVQPSTSGYGFVVVAMKFKRNSIENNRRIRRYGLEKKLGLLSLLSFKTMDM